MNARKVSLSAALAALTLATAGADEPAARPQPSPKAEQPKGKPSKAKAAKAAEAKAAKAKEAKAKEAKELDEQADKQWASVAGKSKDLRGMIDEWKPDNATIGPMVESLSTVDKALGEPPARQSGQAPKLPTSSSLGDLASELKTISQPLTTDPPASAPTGKEPRAARDVKAILYRRSNATNPALLPESKPRVEE